MFSNEEKQDIAKKIEEILLSYNHPEMPKSNPMFYLHIEGKEDWSWADIKPNWFHVNLEPEGSFWNEGYKEENKS